MSKSLSLAAALLAVAPAALAAGPEQGGGMPQLRFGDPLLQAQVVWLLVLFLLLYVLMSGFALPRVARVLEARRKRIDGDLDAARAAKDRADAAMAEHRAATARARAEAQAAVAAALAQAQEAVAARTDAANARLAAQIEAAEARIGAARDTAMGALRNVSADTAEAVVARIIGQADRSAVDFAVGQELQARGRA
jgi:F-type H+-transporting ATPase subunit b